MFYSESQIKEIVLASNMAAPSLFSDVPQAPPVAVFQLTEDYKADTSSKKINLGVGGTFTYYILSGRHDSDFITRCENCIPRKAANP